MIQLKTNQSISSKVNRTIPFNYPAYYTYNTPKNRLTAAGGSSFSYDNEGQLSSGYGANYTFDYEHRLTAIGSTQFTYDGSGKRLQATRSGTVTRHIYDPAGNVLAEADGSNNITRIYVYGKGLLAMVLPATQQDQVYCYHYNATGSAIAVTDGSQTVVNKYAYDPFGNILSQQENIGGQDTRLQNQPFNFVGQFGVMTEPNGFYYMRARYYDPQVGRFISEDPIGFDGGDVNLMAYVGNNPVNGIDPTGTFSLQAAAVGAVIGTVVGGVGALFSDEDVTQGAMIGAAVGALAGFESIGIISGAVVGGSADFAGQVLSNFRSNRPLFSNINTDTIVMSTMSGALGGGGAKLLKTWGAKTAVAVGM